MGAYRPSENFANRSNRKAVSKAGDPLAFYNAIEHYRRQAKKRKGVIEKYGQRKFTNNII